MNEFPHMKSKIDPSVSAKASKIVIGREVPSMKSIFNSRTVQQTDKENSH